MAHNSQQSTASTEWLHLQKRGEEISNGRYFEKRTEDMQTPKRKRYQKDATSADDIITLIHLVRQNPALYNYKLQPNQRRRIDVLNGWAQIAAQIGNKYTVEECRRKWKNLRDTYHQYRLRKPKLEDGLSKWRYAKELDFLSNVYQPKLKSQRHQNYVITSQRSSLHDMSRIKDGVRVKNEVENEMSHHASTGITLVNDDEAFILTTYEESVNDDVATIDHTTHEDPSMSAHMELPNDDDVEDVEETVKNEHASSLDDATAAEVDYEEVCLYEEAGNAPSVDCETIIGGGTGGVARSTSTDSKVFTQHHDQHAHSDSFNYMNDFCIESIPHLPSGSAGGGSSNSSVIGGNSATKLKNVSVATAATSIVSAPVSVTTSGSGNGSGTQATTSSVLQLQAPSYVMYGGQPAEELDLFFAFLKQKMQRFAKEEITAMQVEFLNCVQRREVEKNQSVGGSGNGSVAIIHHQL